ncbi:hypothetical protein KR038_010424 [Drosophila bunnanda]|nr:hypothetical protein KR038_010424 [Drosophila bunnanda]
MSFQRTGFVLDAKSMGINRVSRPPSPSSTDCLCEPSANQEEDSQNVDSSTSIQVMERRDRSELEACGSYAQCNSSTDPLPTEYYRGLLQKLTQETGDAGQVNCELNSIFLKRLCEIDTLNGQCGDTMFSTQLRLVTFQEWVDFLLHVNSVILGNMSELENEAYGKIVSYFNSMQGQQVQALDENRKLRRDICTLIKFVQTGYHRSSWEGIKEISLETLTVNQLLGMKPDQVLPESESEKMAECMKSLVNEMAEKHDEICLLKTKLSNLDEVVLTARQKLLLKDQCIAQLNQQTPGEESFPNACKNLKQDSSGSKVDETSSDQITNCMLQDLAIQDFRENEMLRILDNELNEFLLMHNINEHQRMESWRRRLSSLYEKMSSERNDTVKKLEYIRSQLRLLQSDVDRSHLVFGQPATDVDSKMVESLKDRLDTLSQCNRELQEKYMRLDTDSKMLQTKFEFECGLNERNSQILREIADLICKLSPTEFTYNDIYAETATENPFCEAIKEIFDHISSAERTKEETSQRTCAAVDCPHRQQLEHTLLHCQTQTEILQATRDNYLSIIDEFKRDLEELTEQVEQQQKQQQQQQQQTNQSCPEPELHLEEPPRINCELEIQNERLACQIQGLQDTVKDRDGQIADLQTMIQSYSDVSENNRLKEQIHELKLKNSDQSRQIRELAGAIKSNEQERTDLVTKQENLMRCLEEKGQGLKGAERQVESLQTRLNQLEQLQEELKMEVGILNPSSWKAEAFVNICSSLFELQRSMLRDEVVALKEKEAVSAGRERALLDQQRLGHKELEKMRHVIRDMQGQLQQEESQHRENIRQLEVTKGSLREQMRGLATDCQRMQSQLKKQVEVNQQQEQILVSFRTWKDAQVRSDEAMRRRIKENEERINMLVDENQSLAEDYRCVYRDYQLLEQEMQRVKQAVNYSPIPSMGYPPGGGRMDPEAGNEMARRLQSMATTSQRISNQYRTLNDFPANAVTQYQDRKAHRRPGGDQLRPFSSSDDVS